VSFSFAPLRSKHCPFALNFVCITHAPYQHAALLHGSAVQMASGNIPLLCNICPKKPKFSDVSHLLTHIASKGHLSNYYKVKVRSTHEEDSRLTIEAYDQWYADWNVEELMSDRMNQKDKRRTRARPAGTVLPTSHLCLCV
jgi:hypothetical protein